MKILVLPNAFKGCLSAAQIARIVSRALDKKHQVRAFPVSDGGDGFTSFFEALDNRAERIRVRAKNAFGQTKTAHFLMLADRKTAVIETARVCGLGNTKKEDLDPLGATSYGVGQVILSAVKRGARHIFRRGVLRRRRGVTLCAWCRNYGQRRTRYPFGRRTFTMRPANQS